MGKTFKDKFMGDCTYETFILGTNTGYYSYKCTKGFGHADLVDPEKILIKAKEAGMKIHLSGDEWKKIGLEGRGQLVTALQAEKALKKYKKYQKEMMEEERKKRQDWKEFHGNGHHALVASDRTGGFHSMYITDAKGKRIMGKSLRTRKEAEDMAKAWLKSKETDSHFIVYYKS